MVRAKFKLGSVTRNAVYNWVNGEKVKGEQQTLKFYPVYDGGEENKRFYASTPSGSIELGCVNPEAVAQFELDGEYYIDFSPADPV